MPTFRSTRASRIRYDLPSVMKRRAAAKARERDRSRGNYVLGHLAADSGRVVLLAIEQAPAWTESTILTSDPLRMRLWVTKQAARQWANRRPLLDLHAFNVDRLDIRQPAEPDPRCPTDNATSPAPRSPLTGDQPRAAAAGSG